MPDSGAQTLAKQLALLKALADRPLTLPPIFVKITGSILAGLLLRQVLYWMQRTEDVDGWFYKRLPDFQAEMCMGEKEFRTARGILTEKKFLMTERRGTPPIVFFRADLEAVIDAIERQSKGKTNSAERAELIRPTGQNQLRRKGDAILPKGQNPNSAERAESYKEAETTRDYTEITKAGKPPRLSQSQRDSWDLRRWQDAMRLSDPQPGAHIGDPNAHWRSRAKEAAFEAGLSPERIVELLRQHFPEDSNIDLLYQQKPLFGETA